MIPKSSSRQVQSVEKAFQIISILQDHDGSSIDELASDLDLAKSTVHNYLGTLQTLGYVVERDGIYHLGLRFLTHGMAAKSGLRIRDTVKHNLEEVSQQISQPIWWITEELGRGIFVEQCTIDAISPVYGRVGKRSYLHTHAPGKAILGKMTDERVKQVIEYHGLVELTKETISDAQRLTESLEEIRSQGYAVSDGEAALGIQSVGVAFEGPYGYMHGIGIFDYSHNFSGNSEQNIPAILQDAADSISNSVPQGGL